MTAEMWAVQVEKMRDQFARRGFPWLTTEEEASLRAYLPAPHRHRTPCLRMPMV